MLSCMSPLSVEQLRHLSMHEYKAVGKSLTEPLMQPFWNWCTSKFPVWVAPNLLTIVGLLVNIFTSLLLIMYSPDAKSEVPGVLFFLNAVGLFVYQTLDACDGKQARRTGSANCLGELFDHGCDALSTTFVALGVCVATQIGYYPSWMFVQCFMAMSVFYTAHWQTYVCGALRFGKFDVNEAHFTIMVVYMISAIFGASVWSNTIPGLGIEIRFIPVVFGICAGSIAFLGYLRVIAAGRNSSTTNIHHDTSIVSPVVPLAFINISALVMACKSITGVFVHHPCLYVLVFGFVAAKMTNLLVVAHMTRSEMKRFDRALFIPLVLFFNQYFNTTVNEYALLYICLTCAFLDWFLHSIVVCRQIAQYLNVKMFKISPIEGADGQPKAGDNEHDNGRGDSLANSVSPLLNCESSDMPPPLYTEVIRNT